MEITHENAGIFLNEALLAFLLSCLGAAQKLPHEERWAFLEKEFDQLPEPHRSEWKNRDNWKLPPGMYAQLVANGVAEESRRQEAATAIG